MYLDGIYFLIIVSSDFKISSLLMMIKPLLLLLLLSLFIHFCIMCIYWGQIDPKLTVFYSITGTFLKNVIQFVTKTSVKA